MKQYHLGTNDPNPTYDFSWANFDYLAKAMLITIHNHHTILFLRNTSARQIEAFSFSVLESGLLST